MRVKCEVWVSEENIIKSLFFSSRQNTLSLPRTLFFWLLSECFYKKLSPLCLCLRVFSFLVPFWSFSGVSIFGQNVCSGLVLFLDFLDFLDFCSAPLNFLSSFEDKRCSPYTHTHKNGSVWFREEEQF